MNISNELRADLNKAKRNAYDFKRTRNEDQDKRVAEVNMFDIKGLGMSELSTKTDFNKKVKDFENV